MESTIFWLQLHRSFLFIEKNDFLFGSIGASFLKVIFLNSQIFFLRSIPTNH
jgi:hypothetical protein